MTEGPAAPACAGGGLRRGAATRLEARGRGRLGAVEKAGPWPVALGRDEARPERGFRRPAPGSGGDRAVCLLFEVSYECLEGMLWDRFVGTEVWGVTVEAAKGRGTWTDRSPREARYMRWRSRRGGREDVAPALITLS